jgi:hypothetical protein
MKLWNRFCFSSEEKGCRSGGSCVQASKLGRELTQSIWSEDFIVLQTDSDQLPCSQPLLGMTWICQKLQHHDIPLSILAMESSNLPKGRELLRTQVDQVFCKVLMCLTSVVFRDSDWWNGISWSNVFKQRVNNSSDLCYFTEDFYIVLELVCMCHPSCFSEKYEMEASFIQISDWFSEVNIGGKKKTQ